MNRRGLAWMMVGLAWSAGCTISDTVGVLGAPDVGPRGGEQPDADVDASGFAPDIGPPPTACGGLTEALCEDGMPCAFSGDCVPGSVCNVLGDPYYDPTTPEGVCFRLVCGSDADCDPGETCSLERTCAAITCQSSSDCVADATCFDGLCVPEEPPGACAVLNFEAFVSPSRSVRLEAQAVGGGGDVQGRTFRWTSSEPQRVQVAGDIATGGSELGVAILSASLASDTGVVCSGRVRIENVDRSAPGPVQVHVVAAENGLPRSEARVIVFADGAQHEAVTSTDGVATFPAVVGDVAWVTVVSAGREFVSVRSPGARDLLISVDLAPRPQVAGGFRGVVDVSMAQRGDMYVGLAGAALPLDLSRFRLSTLLGDSIDTVINAPQLGLNAQAVTLPGNLMLRLGNERFTVDREGPDLRCQGHDPTAMELGCYVARAPVGRSIAWTLSTRLKLQDVAAVAGRVSSILGDDFDFVAALPEALTMMRTAPSGVNADIDTREVPRVDAVNGVTSATCSDPDTPPDDRRCRADYSRYASVPLSIAAARRMHIAVTVPPLPSALGEAPEAVLVFTAAVSAYGLVPLGMAAGRDGADAPDGLVDGASQPFGPFSDALPAGQLALSTALHHSGLQGLPLRLIAVAYDRALGTGTGSRISGLVEEPDVLTERMGFGGRSFLGHATGVLDRANGTFVGAVPSGATTMRIDLVRGAHAWRIYAPPTTTTLVLPQIAEVQAAVLGSAVAPTASLQVIRARGSLDHADVFTRGSGVSLSTLHDVTEAFSAQSCAGDVAAHCLIR